MTVSTQPPERVRVTGRRGAGSPAGRADPRDRRARPSSARSDGVAAARPAAAGAAAPWPRWPSRSASCRWSSTSLPASPTSACSGVPLPWLLLGVARLPVCCCCSAGATSAGRSQRARLRRPRRASPRTSGDASRETSLPASSRSSWSPWPRWRSAPGGCGSRAPPATSSSPRAPSGRRSTPARSAGSTSPPRPSSASPGWCSTFGADMLWYPVGWTAGYLVLLVLVAAPLRRSGAYTLPDFAEARLDSPRVAASARCWWSRSAGSTCCRSSRAPALTLEAAIGAPRVGRRGRGRAGRAGQRAAPAGCAASRSCRPSSTG